jgi:cytochrome c oxidase subunit 2
MRAKRFATATIASFVLLLLSVQPALAQSEGVELINNLNQTLLYAALPITILVEAILIYAVVKFKDNDEPKPTRENRRLEITWTVATAVVLLFVGFASYQVLAVETVGNPIDSEERLEPTVAEDYEGAVGPLPEERGEAVQIEVQAFRYGWRMTYEGTEVQTMNEIRIPKDRPVYLHIYSSDWLHMLSVPDLGLKQTAFPGEYNTIKTIATETGNHQYYCTEYCGVGHSQMNGEFIVMEGDAYDQWLSEQQQSSE